jgi:enterochelin esterase-like enzyme
MMINPLLGRAQIAGNPIIDGDRAVLLWKGDPPPRLVGDFNGWNPEAAAPWSQIDVELWSYTLNLPSDAYVEYAFLSQPGDEERITDPFNERTTPNGMGHINNYFHMPGSAPTQLVERAPGVRQGRLSRHRIENDWLLANGKRWIHLYRPPTEAPVPLVVVFDAKDYLTRGRITHIVDNLIAQRRMKPIALALLDNGGTARGIEYSCNDATVGLVLMEVLPLAREHLHLIDPGEHPGAYGVLGASMGGLMALYTGLRAPGIFGHVLSQSGAFELDEMETVIGPLVRHLPVQPLQVWMDVGRFEWLLEPNRRMYALLQERGYDVTYREFNGGHNYPAWRDDLWRGLETLFWSRHHGQ